MRIFLIGYMGSGKSTTGNWLATRLQLPFVDLDAIIESQEGLAVSEIFEQKGETKFRELERTTLVEMINSHPNMVLATGGGTVCSETNLKLMSEAGLTVYLKTSVQVLSGRLRNEKSNRPLLSLVPEEELSEFIGKHLKHRESWYMKCDLIHENDQENHDRLLEQIMNYSNIES